MRPRPVFPTKTFQSPKVATRVGLDSSFLAFSSSFFGAFFGAAWTPEEKDENSERRETEDGGARDANQRRQWIDLRLFRA